MEKEPERQARARSYLDWAATAIPVAFDLNGDSGFAHAVRSGLAFGNPSSQYLEGRLAKEALENARQRCAKVLGVESNRLYFTSGGTESNALVIHSFLRRTGKSRLLYSAIEHPSIRENCLVLEKLGLPVNVMGVEKDGRVTDAVLSKALDKYDDARFIAVMGVNNETGALMDLSSLVSITRAHRKGVSSEKKLPIHFHSDLVQALGKTPINITGWDLDSASFNAHKLGGSRGIGLLYLKKPIEPLYTGGEQEGNIRPGTENTLGAISLADALERHANPDTVRAEQEKARERFKYLIGELRKIKRCGLIPSDREDDDRRFSPWILQARFRDVPGAVMVRALDDSGVAVSTGSACSSASPERPVLAAMGVDETARLEGIRISQGWSTGMADLDALISGIKKTLSFL